MTYLKILLYFDRLNCFFKKPKLATNKRFFLSLIRFYTPLDTQNRSFWKSSPKPISRHSTKETKLNATKANNTRTK